MSPRELVVLGSASQVPTRDRNHNGYLLRWDGEGFLFDPGEGTQRQLTHAGAAAADITRLCITHFHGDHCLGVPGLIQRFSLDQVSHPIRVHYPASGAQYFARLRHACAFHETATLIEEPMTSDGMISQDATGTLFAHRLDHPVDSYGYRLVEPDGRRMIRDRLDRLGISGPDVGRLIRDGHIDVAGRRVTVEEVSEVRRGQRFAFIMDTRLCDGAYILADGADLLVIEATYLDVDADLAAAYGHLTVAQAAQIAAASGVRKVVLTHFSRRYTDLALLEREAAAHFGGEIVMARDLARVPVPARR